MEDSLGELKKLQDEGKIRHIGISETTVDQVKQAREIVDVVSVQNMFNLVERKHEDVLDYCAAEGIAFIPWFPLATGQLIGDGSPLTELAKKHEVSEAQLALAWVLNRSPQMLAIPGTSKVAHLEDNMKAATIDLSDDEFAELEKAA